MKTKLCLLILAAISFWQLFQEIQVLQTLFLTSDKAMELAISTSLLVLGYGVPLISLAYLLKKKKNLTFSWFILAILFGALVLGKQAGLLNVHLSNLLKSSFPNHAVIQAWQPSIVPPVVEESLKLLLALLLLYLSRHKDRWHAMLIGGGVGLGFQLSEDYAYVLGEAVDQKMSLLGQALSRFETAFAGHWLLTAIITVACAILLYEQKNKHPKMTYLWLVCPLIMHILWNSPLIDNNLPLKLVLTVFSWGLLANVYLQNHKATFPEYIDTSQS